MERGVFSYFLVGLLLTLFGYQAEGQDDIPGFDVLKPRITQEESDDFMTVMSSLERAGKADERASGEEKDLQKYFRKNNKRRAERKAVDAKEYVIQAYQGYMDAYDIVYNIYNKRLSGVEYFDQSLEKQVANLRAEADVNQSKAKDLVGQYRDAEKRELKKDVEYMALKRDCKEAHTKMLEALQKQGEAMRLVFEQNDKKFMDQKAWKAASAKDTEDAYISYIRQFPQGEYVENAKQRLNELRAEAERLRQAELAKLKKENVIFKVQIAAVKQRLSKKDIKGLYSRNQQVEETFDNADSMYKYTIGNFKDYEDAKKFKATITSQGAFIVAFKDGNKVHILDALGRGE